MTATRIRAFTVGGPVLDLFVSDCAECGVVFGIPKDLEQRRREDGRAFYCPNGHTMVFSDKPDAEEKLRLAAARETALRDQLTAAVREGELTRQQMLRDRSRFANGVCPCCNRSFENVRRHMASKHPEYDAAEVAKPVRYGCSCGRSFDTYHGLRIHQSKSRPSDWAKPDQPGWRSHLTEGATR